MKRPIVGYLFLLLCYACVSIDGKVVDESFTLASLSQRGLKTTAIQKSSSVRIDRLSGKQLQALLETELRDERDDFRVNPADDSLVSRSILRSFRDNSALSPEQMTQLPQNENSYIVFASVIFDEISYRDSADKNEKDVLVSHQYDARRKMTVAFKVYDPQSQKMVWAGDVNQTKVNSKTYDAKEHRRLMRDNESRNTINTIGKIAGAISGKGDNENILEERNLHPKPPTQRQVLQSIFEGFADSLPD